MTSNLEFLHVSLLSSLLLCGIAAPGNAQTTPEKTDSFGFSRFQTYVQLESFEFFDSQIANVILRFTDLELPGDGGRTLRFTRTYNNALILEGSTTGGWMFGIQGLVMGVIGGGQLPENTIIGQGFTQALTEGGPVLLTADGGARQTFYLVKPEPGPLGDPEAIESERWVRSVDGLKYNQFGYHLYMPDGSICSYENQATPPIPGYRRLTSCASAFDKPFLYVTYDGPTTTYTQPVVDANGNIAHRVIVYGPGPNSTSTLTYLDRTWTYTWSAGRIVAVTPPEGSGWAFEYATAPSPHPYMTSITTPDGGRIDYTYQERTQVHDVPETPQPVSHGFFLYERSVSGPSVTPGTWRLDDFWFDKPTDVFPESFTLLRPSGVETGFANCRSAYTGPLVGPGAGTCRYGNDLRGVEHDWDRVAFESYDGIVLWQLRLEKTTIRDCVVPLLNCATHLTEYLYDQHRNVIQTTERNLDAPSVSRVTVRTYLNHNVLERVEQKMFLGLATSETVGIGSESFSKIWNRDFNTSSNPGTGFVLRESLGALPENGGIATTFQADAYGNVRTATTGTGKQTTYTYEGGVVKDSATPEYTITRTINQEGTVASESQAGRTTTYAYDKLGRLRETDPPGSSAKTVIDYSLLRTVRTTRGTSVITTTLDGFGRPFSTSDNVGVQTRTTYDAEGRKTYQSLPFGGSVPEVGMDFEYDSLNRVTRETHADGSFRRRIYGRGIVTIQDEKGRASVITRQTFGDPDVGRVTRLVDAAGQTWDYSYNVRDALKQVAGPGGVTRTWTYAPTTMLLASETHPESGTTAYTEYDAAGVLKKKLDANGTEFQYSHDGNDRVRMIVAIPSGSSPQLTTISFEPGSDRRDLTTVAYQHSDLDYDASGRISKRRDYIDGREFEAIFSYDTSDNLTEILYPSGLRVGYGYDAANRIDRVFNANTSQDFADAFAYHPSGAVSAYTAGNGLVTTLTYDPERHWLSSISAGPLWLGYEYDAVGNIEAIGDARTAMSQAFAYDALDRLVEVAGMQTPASFPDSTFAYDAHGNRQDSGAATYTYHPGNPFHLQSINGFHSMWYDPNGNLRGGFGGTYDYTPDNLLKESSIGGTTTQFAYDLDAWRLKKEALGGTATYYMRGPGGQMLTEWVNTSPLATVRDYVYAGGRLIAVITKKLPPK